MVNNHLVPLVAHRCSITISFRLLPVAAGVLICLPVDRRGGSCKCQEKGGRIGDTYLERRKGGSEDSVLEEKGGSEVRPKLWYLQMVEIIRIVLLIVGMRLT